MWLLLTRIEKKFIYCIDFKCNSNSFWKNGQIILNDFEGFLNVFFAKEFATLRLMSFVSLKKKTCYIKINDFCVIKEKNKKKTLVDSVVQTFDLNSDFVKWNFFFTQKSSPLRLI